MGTIDTHGYYSYYIKTRPNVPPFRVLIPDDFSPEDTEFVWAWIEYIFPRRQARSKKERATRELEPVASGGITSENILGAQDVEVIGDGVSLLKKPKGRPRKIHVEATPTLLTKLNREELIEHVQGELDRAHKIWSEQNGAEL